MMGLTTQADWPQFVTMAVTDKCFLRCVMCHHALMPDSLFQESPLNPQVTWDFLRKASHIALHGVGEPLCNTNLWDFIPPDLHPENHLGFNTNGLLLGPENRFQVLTRGIGWLDFSIDAGTARTYRRIRGGPWDLLWENIDALIELRGASPYPKLYANMIVMRENRSEISALIRELAPRRFEHLHIYQMNPVDHSFGRWRDLDRWVVPFRDGSGDLFDYEEQGDLTGSDGYIEEAIREARRREFKLVATGPFLGQDGFYRNLTTDGRSEVPESPESVCLRPWQELLIKLNGDFYMCCHQRFPLGNLNEPQDHWNGPVAQGIRRVMLAGGVPEVCQGAHCPELGGGSK